MIFSQLKQSKVKVILIKSLFLAGNYWPLIVEKCVLLAGYGILFIGLAFRLTKRRVG